MNLLKVGGAKHFTGDRWKDALDLFENIYIISYKQEPIIYSNKLIYIRFDGNILQRIVNKFFLKFIRTIKSKKGFDLLTKLCISIIRLNNRVLINRISELSYDFVHSSYSDYDNSDLLTLLLKNVIRKPITRAYKESRPGYNYCEKECFKISNRIILNTKENKEFFEKKYGEFIFHNKEILYSDENYLSERVLNKIKYSEKYSNKDGILRAIILAGRVFSDPSNRRSGSRLYYIPLIKELIDSGIKVYLFTNKIFNDQNGINQYEVLKKEYLDWFFIEEPLDLTGDYVNSYEIMSRFDYGVLHNHIEGTSVSKFDAVNIPHRFYEYQAAHVVPILKKGTTIVMEKFITSKNCGVIYEKTSELLNRDNSNIQFYTPSYKEYINKLY